MLSVIVVAPSGAGKSHFVKEYQPKANQGTYLVDADTISPFKDVYAQVRVSYPDIDGKWWWDKDYPDRAEAIAFKDKLFASATFRYVTKIALMPSWVVLFTAERECARAALSISKGVEVIYLVPTPKDYSRNHQSRAERKITSQPVLSAAQQKDQIDKAKREFLAMHTEYPSRTSAAQRFDADLFAMLEVLIEDTYRQETLRHDKVVFDVAHFDRFVTTNVRLQKEQKGDK